MLDASEIATDDVVPLLQRGPLVIAAIVSVATVIVALVWLVASAFAVAGLGLSLAATAPTRSAAMRATSIVSVGFGLAVGPAVYAFLAILV